MKKRHTILLVLSLVAPPLALNVKAQGNPPLKLVQKIPMPGVQVRMGHFSVEVNGKQISSIRGESKPVTTNNPV